MASPKYFKLFPDLQYAVSANKAGQPTYINIKDYFHLLVPRDDIFREETLYTTYTVQNGQRPDQISQQIYGDSQYYWVILQINEITDYYNQWPLSENELTEFVYKKYGGSAGAGSTHHWQTYKTYDESTPPNLIMEGGLKVPETFTFTYPATPGSNVLLSSSLPYPVSNYTYERDLNDAKSQISVLDKKYIYDWDREVRNYAKKLHPSISFVDLASVTPRT